MESIIFVLIGFGGVLIHSLTKMSSLSKDFEKANMPFNWLKDYVIKDKFSITLSFLSVFLWLALFGEAAKKYPAILDYTRFTFLAMGALGSYAIQLAMSRAKEKIRKAIDEKTNTLDDITNNNQSIMDHWEFSVEDLSNIVQAVDATQYGVTVSAMPVATQDAYYFVPSQQNKIYTQAANITSQSQMILRRANNTTYIAVPIRKPK